MPACQRVLPGDARKAGRFSGAVGPDQGHALTRRHVKAHAINSLDAIKVFDEVLNLQHQSAALTLIVAAGAGGATRCGRKSSGTRSSKPSKPDGAATMISMMNKPSKPRQ